MSDLFSVLNSASSALQAFQNALSVTQNNVSNSQTPGYVTQTPEFDALSFDSANGLSGGVESAGPASSRNPFAELAVQRQVSLLGGSSQLATSLGPIQQAFSVTGTGGVSNALDSLFQSFSAWSASPDDVNARSAVLSAASQVTTAFQQTASQLDQIRSSVDGDLQTTVASINQIAGQIQQYNIQRQASSTPDPGLDAQLNASLESLSQLANIQTLNNPDGTVTVLLGGQVPLVAGSQVDPLSLTYPGSASSANASAPPDATLVDQNGNDVTQDVSEGQLGALLSVRNQVLPQLIGGPSQTGDLNTLASQVAGAVNGVLATGGGQPLFTLDPNSSVDAAATLSVTSGFQPQDLVAADPGPPPVSNGLALQLSNLANNANPNLRGMTFDQFYASSASWIGNQVNQAQTASDAQTQTVAQARALRQQLSGVSLDAEAMRLMQLQRSYQAASQMVSVIDSLAQNIVDMIH